VEPELVDSGRFRVDRRRALDKLMRYQLPDARMYPLPWVQAATASGARNILVTPSPAGLEMTFDGQEWAPDLLSDVYRHIFDAEAAGPRARYRELAIGLLSALRLKPTQISMMFSWRGTEYVQRIGSIEDERMEEAQGVLVHQRARFGPRAVMSLFVSAATDFDRERAYLEEFCTHCPVPIELWGHLVNRKPGRPKLPFRDFAKVNASGRLELVVGAPEWSTIDLVTFGVTISRQRLLLPGVQASGFVRCDGLRKSLSQMGVVKDERYKETVEILGRESMELLNRTVTQVRRSARPVSRRLAGGGLHRWMRWELPSFRERLSSLFSGSGEDSTIDRKTAEVIHRAAVGTAALREACLRGRLSMLKDEPGPAEALWDAPVLFSAGGNALSLRTLEKQRRWLGHVPYVRAVPPAASGRLAAAWAVRPLEVEFLEAFFPGQVQAFKAGSGERPADKRPLLNEEHLLTRQHVGGGPEYGEMGLSISPHPSLSRIRWMSGGQPLGHTVWSLDGLRVEAVMDHPTLSELPRRDVPGKAAVRCVSALVRAAPPLYMKLARKYRPNLDSPRQAAIREHLLDMLAHSWDASKGECPGREWLETLELFRGERGKLFGLKQLRTRSEKNAPVRLAASSHPERLRASFPDYSERLRGLLEAAGLAAKARAASPVPAPAKPRPALPVPASAGSPRPSGERKGEPPAKQCHSVPPAPVSPEARTPVGSLEDELRRWLAELFTRGVLPKHDAVRSLRLVERDGTVLVKRIRGSVPRFELDIRHHMALGNDGMSFSKASIPYLLSVYYSALNRMFRDITDADDEGFTMALAEMATDLLIAEEAS